MSQPQTGTAPPPPPAPAPDARRLAWIEALERLRAGATTEPGRLRIIGAVLALLVVLFGAVTAWQVTDRAAAARDVVERSQPLSADAASIYRSLADADTTAAGGFLARGTESPATRERYADDIATASRLLVTAAANTRGSDDSRRLIEKLSGELPRYTGLIETARTNKRQGLPLGGAYLRYANDRMRNELLPTARKLYDAESARLSADYDEAKAWPWVALGAGAVALAGLGWAQRRNYRRTNRVFNHGLLAATAASAVVLLWLTAAHAVASTGLNNSWNQGARSLRVLNEARIDALQARGDENLTLVARGAVLTKDQQDFYEVGYRSGMKGLAGGSDGKGGKLGTALALADDEEGKRLVRKAQTNVGEWQQRHVRAREADDRGAYEQALKRVNGTDRPTRESFDRVDAHLRQALEHEQREFRQAADDGRGALGGLAAGAAVLAVLGAAGAVLGIGRRLSEYR